jgi:hypothetical protein
MHQTENDKWKLRTPVNDLQRSRILTKTIQLLHRHSDQKKNVNLYWKNKCLIVSSWQQNPQCTFPRQFLFAKLFLVRIIILLHNF